MGKRHWLLSLMVNLPRLTDIWTDWKTIKAEYIIFDKVGSNPTKPVVEEGGRFAKENGCDFIVAYLI